MTTETNGVSVPVRIGWAAGLVITAIVILVSILAPAVVVLAVGGSPMAGGMAMFGGIVAGWFAYMGVVRLGRLRGWLA